MVWNFLRRSDSLLRAAARGARTSIDTRKQFSRLYRFGLLQRLKMLRSRLGVGMVRFGLLLLRWVLGLSRCPQQLSYW